VKNQDIHITKYNENSIYRSRKALKKLNYKRKKIENQRKYKFYERITKIKRTKAITSFMLSSTGEKTKTSNKSEKIFYELMFRNIR
jgi:hypothetical protein